MLNSIEKIKYDCEKKLFCIHYNSVRVFVQEENFSSQMLRRIIMFIDSYVGKDEVEESVYRVIKFGEETCFEKINVRK